MAHSENDIFEKALLYALEKHHGVTRKSEDIPFLLHPMEVAVIVSTMSTDRSLYAAALLHDTVEDTDATIEEIEDLFGHEIMELVKSETEDKRPGIPASDTWQVRKEESLAVLAASTDLNVKKLWLADKLANARSFYRLHRAKGPAMWEGFHMHDPEKQEWYYRQVAELTEELKDYPAWQEYCALLDLIFGGKEDESY